MRPLDVAIGGRVIRCDGSTAVEVGRDPACPVAVADERVSRHHATLRPAPSGWFWDDRSSGGTWHQGTRLGQFAVDREITVRLGDPTTGPELRLIPAAVAAPPVEPQYVPPAQPYVPPAQPYVPPAQPYVPPAQPYVPPAQPYVPPVPAQPTGHVVSPSGPAPVGLDITGPAGSHRALVGQQATIGRDPSCTLTVDQPQVSRIHLRIGFEPGTGWVATDNGSSGGTYLDGNRVQRMVIDRPLSVTLSHPTDGPVIGLRPAADDRLGPSIRSRAAGPSLVMSRPVQQRIRVGRAPDNDIVLDDLTVSRYHAELRAGPAGYELVDLGSGVGTFLNGARVTQAMITEGALVGIGRHFFVFSRGQLDQYVDDAADLVVRDICFDVPGRRLVDEIGFALEPGQLLAVLGTTGAGKSTLLRALTGFVPATSGQVGYNGRDLYASMEELRYRIGYVPQDDILHAGLKLRQALQFSAELRFSDDTSPAERAARVDEVLGELGLAQRADLPITKLSGGQRKRASVSVELLTRPSLLFLDEPTSGLDPGFERSVMELLRELADGGRTVIVITHSTASLALCDRVLFLAPGGRMAYYGPPADALTYFGNADFPDVFKRLEFENTDWKGQFRAHPAYEQYVAGPVRAASPVAAPAYQPAPAAGLRRRGAGTGRQLRTLLHRNVAVIAGTRANAILLLAQAPIMAVLLLAALQVGNLKGVDDFGEFHGDPRTLLMILIVAAVAMGLINSVREIVKELEIYKRERTVGLSLTAYLGSKFLCLGVLAAAQAAVLTLLVVVPQGGSPAYPFTLGIVVFLTALSAVAFGLAISALVSADSTALVLIPVLIVGQLIFSNAVLEVGSKPVLGQAAWVSQSFWGYNAAASAVNLRETDRACVRKLAEGDSGGGGRSASCSKLWGHNPGFYLLGVGQLLLLAGVGAGASVLALRRRDPLRRAGR